MNDNSSILNINLENQETNNLLSKSQDSYEIYSINGTKCKSGLLNRYNSIDISSLANGMYFVTIHNSNSILQKEQFIVNHWEIRRLSEPGKKFSLPDPFQSVLARAGIDTRYPRGETPRHEPLRLLATTGSPAHQRGLSADDGATAGDGVVAAEVFRWSDNRRESKTNHLLWRLRNKTYTLLI